MVNADEMCNACECSGMVPPPNVRTTESEMATVNLLLAAALTKSERENAELREQMERLVTLLRNDCDIDASWDGLRKFWSIGLTEDGCLMRDRACKAEAENQKLRELLDFALPIAMYAASTEEGDRIRELMREVEL